MKRIMTSLMVLTALTLATHAQAKDEATAVVKAEIGKAAPEFTLMDANGQKHSLSSFKGKTVVLEWTNFDCPFVRKFYKVGAMQELQANMVADSVVWLSICSSAPGLEGFLEGKALTDRIVSEKCAHTAYLVDTDGAVGKMYGAKTTPHMYVVDKSGTLVYAGAIDDKPSTKPEDIPAAKNYVREALSSLKSGKPVEMSATTSYGCSVKYAKK